MLCRLSPFQLDDFLMMLIFFAVALGGEEKRAGRLRKKLFVMSRAVSVGFCFFLFLFCFFVLFVCAVCVVLFKLSSLRRYRSRLLFPIQANNLCH